MNASARKKHSPYMEWAKTRSHAKYNLATSGLIGVPRTDFPLRLEELEITAPGTYGYGPLQQRIAKHAGVPEECVVAATGTSMANHLAMAAVLDPGDEVVDRAAGLRTASRRRGVSRSAREAHSSPVRNWICALTWPTLQSAITPATRLIVLTNLHNPSGALISDGNASRDWRNRPSRWSACVGRRSLSRNAVWASSAVLLSHRQVHRPGQ